MPNVNDVNNTAIPVGTGSTALLTLVMRLHFYIGLFVGPFIVIAALTGTLYVLTPQFEDRLYAHALYVDTPGQAQPLSAQIKAAQTIMVEQPHARLLAVRPAPTPMSTTRVMFSLPTLGPSQSHAVFIDPVTLAVRGQLTVYGTSGILPFRTWLDHVHQGLLLGSVGRLYSELAASWLWVAALGGIYLWFMTRTQARYRPGRPSAKSPTLRAARLRHWHTRLGAMLLLGMLFFSTTGLTWSQWAGGNIALWRAAMGWQTPTVNTVLTQSAPLMSHDEHADHHGHMLHATHQIPALDVTRFDHILHAARDAGLVSAKLEIRPATVANQAWTVTEIERHWPTQADAVAINPTNVEIVDHVRFSQYPLAAKLTRWGIDAHMGILFGLPNQLLLAAFGIGLCVMILWGYRMWWIKHTRQRLQGMPSPVNTLFAAFRELDHRAKGMIIVITLLLSVCLPVMGISLLLFLFIDMLRWYRCQAVDTSPQRAR